MEAKEIKICFLGSQTLTPGVSACQFLYKNIQKLVGLDLPDRPDEEIAILLRSTESPFVGKLRFSNRNVVVNVSIWPVDSTSLALRDILLNEQYVTIDAFVILLSPLVDNQSNLPYDLWPYILSKSHGRVPVFLVPVGYDWVKANTIWINQRSLLEFQLSQCEQLKKEMKIVAKEKNYTNVVLQLRCCDLLPTNQDSQTSFFRTMRYVVKKILLTSTDCSLL